MADHITLPRVTVEQALSLCESVQGLHTDDEDGSTVWCQELIDALRAALAQQAEPVADPFNCPKCGRHDYGLHGACPTCDAQQAEPVEPVACSNTFGCRCPKHFAAQQAEPVQRKPLTEEEIVDSVRESDLDWQAGWTLDEHEPNRFTTLVRAVERAHGIKEKA